MRVRALAATVWVGWVMAWGQGTSQPARLPPPNATAQNNARTLIHKLFARDYAKTSPDDRIALAQRLLGEAADTKDDSAARYELYIEAGQLASRAGDATTALAAISAMSRQYAVNIIPLKVQALTVADHAATTPDRCAAVATRALEVAEQAVSAENFPAVLKMATLADAAATKSRKVSVAAAVQPRVAEYRALAAEYDRVRHALDLLKKEPKDPAAHLVVGTFYALHEGNWQVGLPHLAMGADENLSALAKTELAHPADPFKQVILGDAWWNLAEKAGGREELIVAHHAIDWYRAARANIQGLTLTRIDARIQSGAPDGAMRPGLLANLAGAADASLPAGPISASASLGIVPPLEETTGTNLLALVHLPKDAAAGKWTLSSAGLTCEDSHYAALQLPAPLPQEYDLQVEFTRVEGSGPIAVLLSAHKHIFGLELDVKGEARFERVANKIAKDNPTLAPVAISNGRQYRLTVQIRKESIAALLDGKLLTSWKTDGKDLSRYTLWKLPDDAYCGVGANNAQVLFHSIRLTPINDAGVPAQ